MLTISSCQVVLLIDKKKWLFLVSGHPIRKMENIGFAFGNPVGNVLWFVAVDISFVHTLTLKKYDLSLFIWKSLFIQYVFMKYLQFDAIWIKISESITYFIKTRVLSNNWSRLPACIPFITVVVFIRIVCHCQSNCMHSIFAFFYYRFIPWV